MLKNTSSPLYSKIYQKQEESQIIYAPNLPEKVSHLSLEDLHE